MEDVDIDQPLKDAGFVYKPPSKESLEKFKKECPWIFEEKIYGSFDK